MKKQKRRNSMKDTRNLKINQNGMVTTAIEDGHELDGMNLILKRYPWVDPDWLLMQRRYLVKDRVVAVTRCHEDDVYDAEVGRNTAMMKLNRMVMTQRESAVKLFEQFIRKQMDSPASKSANYKNEAA